MRAVAFAIIAAAVLIAGSVLLVASRSSGQAGDQVLPGGNVAVAEGVQVIDLTAKGGYRPYQSVAQAGIPTILRVRTKGTFDCSSALRIPLLGISRNLPQTGTTDIDLGTPRPGTLRGTCGMGMYPFEIEFKDEAPAPAV